MPEPVAIVGIGCLFPKAPDLGTYWRNVLDARDCLEDVPEGHSWSPRDYHDPDPSAPDKTWATRGGFLDKLPFDPLQHGIPPAMLESIDTAQLLSLVVAREALRDAGVDPDGTGWDRERTGCILGVTGTQEMAITAGARLQGPIWRRSLLRCGVDPALADVIVKDIANHFPTWTEQTFPGLLGNVVAGRIANRLDLGGTNAVVDAACASSLAAVQYAMGELEAGRSDLVLSGGADTLNDIFMFECFTRTPAFTRKGDARPFDAEADGILIGEGIAIVALQRLSDAERDGRRIYAVIKGLGSSSDGRHKSIYAPNPSGQTKALRRAYAQANIDPATIELVEAHGTGTKAGDAAEIEALTEVYRATGRTDRWVALGSVKSQIGHTKSTAGAAGLVKVALALHQRVLPPTAKIDRPNPKMGFDVGPFYLNTRARPWVRRADHPRRAAVSAFGFGGSNFHAVLEEHGPDAVAAQAPAETELFLVGASDRTSLERALDGLGGPTLAHAARASLRAWRPQQAHVVAMVASSLDELALRVRIARSRLAGAPAGPKDGVWVGGGAHEGRVAIVFPGQGSQYVEMGRALAVRYPTVRRAFDLADTAVPGLAARVFPPPAFGAAEEEAQAAALRATEWAQPAIGALAKGMADLLAAFGVRPDATAGHSYGELVALHVAGALDGPALFAASRERGQRMSASGRDRGTMAAIDGPLDRIVALLPDGVVLANRNHPTQGVVSGPHDAVAVAVRRATDAGMTARALSVAAAFHSPLVADARGPFRAALADLPVGAPRIPVVSCATARPYDAEPDAIRDALADQLAQPVDWVGTVDALRALGVTTVIEAGPRGVLAGLVERCAPDLRVVAVDRLGPKPSFPGPSPGHEADAQLKRALAALAAAGLPVDPAPLLAEREPPLPRQPGGPATVWLAGANHRNPSTLEPPMPEHLVPGKPPGAAPTDGWAAVPSTGQPMARPVHLEVAEPPPPRPAAGPPSDLLALLESTRATLAAFQDAQAKTAEVHAKFLEASTRANESFARLFEAQTRLVERVAGNGVAAPAPPQAPAPTWSAPTEVGRVALPTADLPAVATDLPPLFDARAAVEARGAPAPTPRASDPARLREAVLAAVAAKTGYPRETLDPAMDLESDLGIDSIKRVEILSAVRESVPGLPEVDNERLSALRTLQDVIGVLGASTAPVPQILVPHHPPRRDTLVGALLDTVAAKTGYPRDTLDLGMDLESDLGVDSIKRVEILSAVRDRLPDLPELDNELLASLRTLGDVADHLGGVAAGLGFALIGSHARTAGAPALLVPPAAEPAPAVEAPGLPPVQTASDLVLPRRSLRRRVVSLVPAPPGTPVATDGHWVAIGPLADRVVSGLRARGVRATVAEVGALPPDVTAAVASGDPRGAFALAKATGALQTFATVSRRGGRFGRDGATGDPLEGALAGLPKTLAREWPRARCLALDVPDDVDPDRLADELLRDRGVAEVGLAPEGGVTLAVDLRVATPGDLPLADGDLVVVTGGARGVTAACVRALAGRVGAAFLLLGRSPPEDDPDWARGVPDAALVGRLLATSKGTRPKDAEARAAAVRAAREVRATLAALGDRATYAAVDGRDAAAVRAAVGSAVARHGPVRAIVHGAGVLADRRVADKTPAQFDQVFSTKVDGLAALLAAVDPAELRLACAFTSVAGRFGNAGQCDYAMANEALVHALLDLSARHGVRVKAIDWGPWDGGMVDPALKARFEAAGHHVIPLAEGAAAFVDELAQPEPEVVIEGPLPCPGSEERELRAGAPWLADHVIGGRPVVPLAMVLEWVVAAAGQVAPARRVVAVRDLQVLKGIVLAEPRATVSLAWEPAGADALRFEVLGDRPHYRATVVLGDGAPVAPAPGPDGLAKEPYAHALPDAYAAFLFHGPALRGLAEVVGLSDRGIVARVRSSRPADLGVAAAAWATDPLAVDAVLQAVLLWVREKHGSAALPLALGEFRAFGPFAGPLVAHVRLEAAGPRAGTFDADLVDLGGHLVASLSGGRYAADPSFAAPFRETTARVV